MRYFPIFVVLAALACSDSRASAQCIYFAPPPAPDMCNPGLYYMNCYGMVYGPNYFVRPWFPPYQGVIPGMACAGSPAAFRQQQQQQQQAGGGGGGIGFNRHLFARSPRDFFMYDTDSRISPYSYGYATYSGRPYDCKD